MIVSIGGTVGSGKSTLGVSLAKKLGWRRYYMGQIFRDLARKEGLTLREYLVKGETDERIDRQVDEYQIKLGRTKDNFVIEGRTSFLMIPQSLKIFLYTDLDTAAARIFSNLQKDSAKRNEGDLETPAEVKKELKKRMATDRKRYRMYYQINVFNKKHYDLALDTSNMAKTEVLSAVYRFYREQIKKKSEVKTPDKPLRRGKKNS